MNYFDAPAGSGVYLTPQDLVGACYERDLWNVLFNEHSVGAEFFDLSSGVAGDMVQKLVNYGIRAAVVVPDPALYSAAFRDFAREANRTGPIRFFRDRAAAAAWLSES